MSNLSEWSRSCSRLFCLDQGPGPNKFGRSRSRLQDLGLPEPEPQHWHQVIEEDKMHYFISMKVPLSTLFFSHSNSNPNKKASYPIATLTISSEDTWMLSSFWSWGRALITVSLNITEVKIYIRLRCVNHGCDGFGSRSHGSESLLNFFITFF